MIGGAPATFVMSFEGVREENVGVSKRAEQPGLGVGCRRRCGRCPL